MKFEWDENKRQSNLQKHGIDFYEAEELFRNPLMIRLDERFDYDERWIGLGITHKSIVMIVYTEIDEETI